MPNSALRYYEILHKNTGTETGVLWGVICEYFWENWPIYNDTEVCPTKSAVSLYGVSIPNLKSDRQKLHHSFMNDPYTNIVDRME